MKTCTAFGSKLLLTIGLATGLVYSAQTQFPNPLQLSGLNGNSGFVIDGESTDDRSGY